MHPIDRKNRQFVLIISVLAIIVTSICIVVNPLYVSILIAYIFFLLEKRKQIKNIIALTAAYLIIANIIVLVLDNVLFRLIFRESFQVPVRFLLGLITYFLLFSINFLRFQNMQFLEIIKNEKEHFALINKYPDLICAHHNCRTRKTTILGFIIINCRVSWFCFKQKKIREAKQIIGVIGKEMKKTIYKNNLCVSIWDSKRKKIVNGDFDIIEIHENNETKDYNAIINKIIDFLYNEIKRFKPINEVVVKIIGNPQISESTKRRLEEHFLKVEYQVLEFEKV